MKKIFTFFAAVAMFAIFTPVALAQTTFSYTYQGQTLTYICTGVGISTAMVSGSPSDLNGSLTIPSTVTYNGTQRTVTKIADNVFSGRTGLTSVTIPNSVTSIGAGAFYACTGLTSMVVNSGNTVYDSRNNCNAIIETASNTLLYGCMNTTIPNSVTSIRHNAFSYCTGLTSVTIPNSVITIGKYAFSNCTGLTSVTIPNSVTSIDSGVFSHCTGLTSVTIPNSVITIGRYAFSNCTGLTSVTIPNSVTCIYDEAFWGCPGLTGTLTIPNSVTYISVGAFGGCTGLTSVTIGNSVTMIARHAFLGCSAMTSLTLGSSVTTICVEAFKSCTSLTEIHSLNPVPPQLQNAAYGHPGNNFEGVDKYNLYIYIPCGSYSNYVPSIYNGWLGVSASRFIEEGSHSFSAVSANEQMGTVSILSARHTCIDQQAEVSARSKTGYHFVRWSDGSTENPYTINITEDTELIGYFESNNGGGNGGNNAIDNPEKSDTPVRIYSENGRIHVTVAGQAPDNFAVYDVMGRRVFQASNADETHTLPAGLYMVKVGDQPSRKVLVR